MAFDLYPFVRPLLFRMDAEAAHHLAIALLKKGFYQSANLPDDAVLRTRIGRFDLAHPLGLAAGFDKQAEVIQDTLDMGFAFTELGGVTPLPQPGNPSPRLFRIPENHAVINRFGFNSIGADAFRRRMIAYRDSQTRAAHRFVGINLGKNKETTDAADDYVKGIATLAPHADFLTLNVSSPNTPGLRDMQERGALTELLQRALKARVDSGASPMLFLKIAPDLTDTQITDIAETVLGTHIDGASIDGMIVGNTTMSRPAAVTSPLAKESGGLSGKPLCALSTQTLGKIYQATGGKMPLIGAGGVFTGADAYAKIRAGASLIQLYTALIYEGPLVIGRIATELAALLRRDGFASVAAAVGADFKK